VRTLPVAELRNRLASGALSALDLAQDCIAHIEAREHEVQAWAWFDADYVRQQARAMDAYRISGRPLGPLHGLPVGIKDIIDIKGIPTGNGFVPGEAAKPRRDAFVVERLKAAGAIIMGKTVTTELAFMHPSKTRNPRNLEHTPGGSSAGSAAAVADGMVPLAIGTQTGGSVIRPASFCGVTGFKPTFGAIPRRGVLAQSPSLDTLGVFAADPTGAAILAEVLYGHDAEDAETALAPHPRLYETAGSAPPLKPVFAIAQVPGMEETDQDTRDAFAELADALGEGAFHIELPPLFSDALAARQRIHFAEMARCYHHYWSKAKDNLSAEVRAAIEEGNGVLARDYLSALDFKTVLNAGLEEIFERCDAIICPAAPGPAPQGLGSTGNPVFNGLWTFCGTPAVTVPLLAGSNGLPMGVQLIGPHGNDGRLLRTARWLFEWADQ
jgi:Asp-tRNA(Asn)/Glu-tRNA(Gln) amidotransferase A subunit family amidase